MSKNFFRKPLVFRGITLLNVFTKLVEVNGVEPMTPCLQSRCSSQLSYTPKSFCFRAFRTDKCSPAQIRTADLYIISVAL